MSKLNELREKRGAIAAQMTALVKAGLTAETQVQFNKMDTDQEAIASEIRSIEKSEALETELRSAAGKVENAQVGTNKSGEKRDFGKEYSGAFAKYLRNGAASLSEIREMANVLPRDREGRIEMRADDQAASMWGNVTGQTYSGTNGTQGGVFVPASFMYDVDVATKYYAPLMTEGVCRVIETATGAVLPYPTANDTSNSAAVLADAVQDSEQSVPLGVVNFGAYKYTSKIVRVSLELLQDSAFNLEDFLKQQFAIRFGRGFEAAFTVGTGSAQPTGILTAVLASGAVPVVGAGSSANDGSGLAATTIGTNDLIALEHSVDPTYRRSGKFMLSDASLKTIKLLLDKYGRPLWVPGLASNAPDQILGYSYTINQSLPAATATKNSVLFGDLSKFIIRKVRDMSVLRLDERYADYGQVGFIAFARVDSNLVDAGTHPINVLQQHS